MDPAEFERLRRMRLLYTLGCYLRRGGTFEFRERMHGDGSGLPAGWLRYEITFEAPLFWQIWAELSERHGWLK